MFNPLINAIKLSPSFSLNAACSIGLMIDCKEEKSDRKAILFLAFLGAFTNLIVIAANYSRYIKISQNLTKYGYNPSYTHKYFDSFCGRQQLKMAARDLNFRDQYKVQINSFNFFKRHQINASPIMSLIELSLAALCPSALLSLIALRRSENLQDIIFKKISQMS